MFCADFWDEPAQCIVILDAIGISPSSVDMTPPAIMRWYSIIRHLMRLDDGSMGRLVIVLMTEYPNNDALRTVCAPWIPALPSQIQVLPQKRLTVEDDLVPVVVPIDFADEADTVVPKMDTLWSTVVEVNKRLILLEATVRELASVLANEKGSS